MTANFWCWTAVPASCLLEIRISQKRFERCCWKKSSVSARKAWMKNCSPYAKIRCMVN
ncbi:hypothetical protein EVA_10349 [gut metagenome]|uniref:Uncharacterized protein n=1 Tax=gut metagenome TaxID=749906 RepID=J9G3Z0_9ZZZZ